MNREDERNEMKARLAEYVESITERSKGRNMYVCPLCGSGKGAHSTGAFSIYEGDTRWKCFACGEAGDVFDLIGAVHAMADYSEQEAIARRFFGFAEYEPEGGRHASQNGQKQAKNGHIQECRRMTTCAQSHIYDNMHTETGGAPVDFTPLFLEAQKRLNETDYLQRRGISAEIAARFGLGFLPSWRHPKVPTAPLTPRLIIPTSKFGYLARDTRESIPAEQSEYKKLKAGKGQVFNLATLESASKPVFIVEGELDAMSIIQSGAEAVGLGSITAVKAFLEAVQRMNPRVPFVVALDNETELQKREKVLKAVEELEAGLQSVGLLSYRYNVAGAYHDANEALQHDPAGLKAEVARIVAEVEAAAATAQAEKAQEYALQNAAANWIAAFKQNIIDRAKVPAISTGFFYLDRALDGGLYEGLYIVGAISSLGKTTLVLQMADNIAEEGRDVLIFSLEMARFELMAKSISRQTCRVMTAHGLGKEAAKTTRGVMDGARYAKYSEAEKAALKQAFDEYAKYACNVYIFEGQGDIGALEIRRAVERHISLTGRAPVVIVDYLQIIAPADSRMTDKQNTDKAVSDLKRISRDFSVPVIGISSFNRANYKEAVSMEAFKESGAIEYSSDVLIGLQLKGASEKGADINELKAKNPREVELIVLKNRNGKTGSRVEFKFYPAFNFFDPCPQ